MGCAGSRAFGRLESSPGNPIGYHGDFDLLAFCRHGCYRFGVGAECRNRYVLDETIPLTTSQMEHA
jgi:hypothetical protein